MTPRSCHTFSMGAAAFEVSKTCVCGVVPALTTHDFVTMYLRGWDTFCRKQALILHAHDSYKAQ